MVDNVVEAVIGLGSRGTAVDGVAVGRESILD